MKINTKLLTALSISVLLANGTQAQEAWDLTRCIDYAIAHNLTVKQQEAARDKSEVELNTAKWSRLPDLNGSASHSFNFGRSLQANNTYQSINTQNTGLNLSTSVPLFTHRPQPEYERTLVHRYADTQQHCALQTEPESGYRRFEQGQRRHQH